MSSPGRYSSACTCHFRTASRSLLMEVPGHWIVSGFQTRGIDTASGSSQCSSHTGAAVWCHNGSFTHHTKVASTQATLVNYYSIIRCTPAVLKVLGNASILGSGPTCRLASSSASSKLALVFMPIPRAYPGSYAPTT